MPARMPIRAISRPLTSDGAYIASTWLWITQAVLRVGVDGRGRAC